MDAAIDSASANPPLEPRQALPGKAGCSEDGRTPADRAAAERRRCLFALAVIAVAWAGLVLVRLTAPSDLLTRDQERVVSYVLDITDRGSWILQHDIWGDVASKPPMFNWLAGVSTLARGRIDRVAASWPSILASLIVVVLVFGLTRRVHGDAAGVWAVLLYLFSQMGLRQVLLVRTDTLFQMFTFLGTLAVWRAWSSGGRGWTWVWCALVAASLTKGPHAIAFALVGLAAVPWHRASVRRMGDGHELPLRGGGWKPHASGLAVLGLAVAWFVAALNVGGEAVVDKWFRDELAGHLVDDHGQPFGFGFVLSFSWFLSRLAPMSVFAALAAWRLFRAGGASRADAWQRFLVCQILGVLVLIGFGSKVRFVHLLPLMPAAAILGGGELARLFGSRCYRSMSSAAVTALVALLGSWGYLHLADARNAPLVAGERVEAFAREVARTLDPATSVVTLLPSAAELADRGPDNRIIAPRAGALDFHWNRFRPPVDRAGAASFLTASRTDGRPAGVVVANPDFLPGLEVLGPVRKAVDVELPLGMHPDDHLVLLVPRADADDLAEAPPRRPDPICPGLSWWLFVATCGLGVGWIGRSTMRTPRL